MNHKYLIDANVLSTSRVMQAIDTDFFNDNCIIIDEIAHELDAIISTDTKQKTMPVNAHILLMLSDIVDDLVRLGILKTDHGNGDALLLATALSIRDGGDSQASLQFMRDHPIIVTEEKLVDAYAKSLGLDAINGKEFIEILDQ